MSDDQQPKKPLEDLKEGLGLLYRAAKGAAKSLPTDKIEATARGAYKEVGKAVESLGTEVDKLWSSAAGIDGKDGAPPHASTQPQNEEEKKKDAPPPQEPHWDDAYAPEPPPPKGPRVG